MGRRGEIAAQGDHETLIARVRWLWDNRRELPFDVEPGPAGQWYFADWLADVKTRRMSWGARGGHMDTICYAWGEHPPCSCPGTEEDLEDLFHGLEETDRRAILRSWVAQDGRIWQPGLCKTYLAQIEGRVAAMRGACVKHNKERELLLVDQAALVFHSLPPYRPVVPPTCPPPAPHLPPTSEGGALQSSSSSSTSNKEEDPPLPPEGGDPPPPRQRKLPRKTTAADVERELVIPAELLTAGIDAEAVAKRVRTCKILKFIETWQDELDRLAPLIGELGEDLVSEVWTDATNGQWQGCTPTQCRDRARSAIRKPVQGNGGRPDMTSGADLDWTAYAEERAAEDERLEPLRLALSQAEREHGEESPEYDAALLALMEAQE